MSSLGDFFGVRRRRRQRAGQRFIPSSGAQHVVAPYVPPGAVFYAADVTSVATILPGFFANGNSFPPATVSGSNSVVAPFVASTSEVYLPYFASGTVVGPPFLDESANRFYPFAVIGSAVDVEAPFFQNDNTFFGASVRRVVRAPFFQNDNTFFEPITLNLFAYAPFLQNVNVFPAHRVGTTVRPEFFTSVNVFHAALITTTNAIAPPFLPHDNRFFTLNVGSAQFMSFGEVFYNGNAFFGHRVTVRGFNYLYASRRGKYKPGVLHADDGSGYRPCRAAWVRSGGQWQQVYAETIE